MRKKIIAISLSIACVLTSLCSSVLGGDSIQADVKTDGVAQPNVEQYKDVDYSFLETFTYGSNTGKDIYLQFDTVQDLMCSDDIRLKEGKYIKTNGYYKSGDMGGMAYVLSKKKSGYGSLELSNGLYANIVPDIYVDEYGTKWAVFNVRQFGAKGDGQNPENGMVNETIAMAASFAEQSEFDRGIAYLPKGEYKAGDQIHANVSNVNIVGCGEESVIFTDNDFRKDASYYEHFFMSWNGKNNYFGSFKVEAREVNYTKYMRQMSLFYCENVYIYDVDLVVPQEAWTGDCYEDKQYTNLTIYTGDKNIVVDSCTMYQMSGTYRGANIGIMDFWETGTENITIKNCELHDNARDEQVGIFSRSGKPNSYIRNVDFINNKVYTYTTPYKDIHGWRTMCFTIAYSDQQVDDIYLANNHFISDADSKFMTFGDVTNCLLENNIFEIKSSNGNMGYVFDSSNGDNDNVIIRNNEFFFTYKNSPSEGKSFSAGKLTFLNNRIFSDCSMYKLADRQGRYEDNTIITMVPFTSLGSAPYFSRNTVYAYGGHAGYYNEMLFMLLESMDENIYTDNVIYDYTFYNGCKSIEKPFDRLSTVRATLNKFDFSGNTYNCPNYSYTNEDEKLFITWYRDASIKEFICENNDFQGAKGLYGYSGEYDETKNTFREFTSNPEIPRITSIKMLNNNKEINEVFTTEDLVKLDANVYVDDELVKDRDIVWISGVEGIATVDNTGLVKKVKDGSVNIYATSTDGSKVYGKVTVHFEKSTITDIELDVDTVTLEPNKKYKVMYEVQPKQSGLTQLEWISQDDTIATVSDDGIISALKEGSTVINVSTKDGSNITKKIKVVVKPLSVKSIYFRDTYKYLNKGDTYQIEVVAYSPDEAGNKGIGKWMSTNENVAKVDSNGLVTVVDVGETSIRGYSMDLSCYASCHIYVEPDKATVLTATSDNSSVRLSWDKVENVHGYIVYRWNESTSSWDNINTLTSADELYYKDSDLSQDTEYKYYVTSYISRWDNYGQQHISESPKSNICVIKTDDQVYVNKIVPTTSEASVPVGWTIRILSRVYPANAVGGNLKYKIEDETIAEITSINNVTTVEIKGLKAGETNLIISDEYDKCIVKVHIGVTPTYKVAELEGSTKYNTATINWKGIPEEDKIDGYVVLRTSSIEFFPIATISKEELETAIYSDGTTCYTYTDKDITFDRTYRYRIVPYVVYNSRIYTCVSSNYISLTTPAYVPVESVKAESVYIVDLNKSIYIQATASNEDALKKEFIWYLSDNSEIIKLEEQSVDTVKVTGLKTGITSVDIVANDEDAAYVTSKIIVLPSKISSVTKTVTTKSIELGWDRVEGADGYNVYKYNAKDASWNLVEATKDAVYTDTKIESNTSYLYKISAYIINDEIKHEGPVSKEIKVKTKDVVLEQPDNSGYEEPEKPTENEELEDTKVQVPIDSANTNDKVQVEFLYIVLMLSGIAVLVLRKRRVCRF